MQRWLKGGLIALGGAAGLIGGSALLSWLTRPRWPEVESLILEPEVDAAVLRLADGAFHLAWHVPADTVTITAGPTPEAAAQGAPLAEAHAAQQATVDGLTDPRPYFALHLSGGPLDGQTLTVAERILPLTGVPNVRDLGGYRTADGRTVRWGQLYRAGDLSLLTPDDTALLRALDIRFVCDLRSSGEIAAAPYTLPDDFPATYLHQPIYDTAGALLSGREILLNRSRIDQMLTDGYLHTFIDAGAPYFGTVLRRLADPANRPALFHCTAGKDRTGLTAALLLTILGVPEPVIVADYSLTNRFYAVLSQQITAALRGPIRLWMRPSDLQPALTADPATIIATFDHLRARYGSPEAYLRDAAGLDDAVFDQLRAGLLKPTAKI